MACAGALSLLAWDGGPMAGGGMKGRRARASVAVVFVGVLAASAVAGAPAGAALDGAGLGAGRGRAGELDRSFGDGGIVLTDDAGASDLGNDVLVQPDGKVVAAGAWGATTGTTVTATFGVARYDHRGRLDRTFGGDGRVATDVGEGVDIANAVVRQRDGKLVAIGTTYGASGSEPRIALARYRPDGRLDPTFGDGGVVVTAVGEQAFADGAAIGPDGRVVVAGYTYGANEAVLARYTSNGELDPAFGDGGVVTTAFGGRYARAYDVAVGADGSIVTAGQAGFGDTDDWGVARFRPDGTPDPSFGGDGIATVSVSDLAYEDARSLALLPGGAVALLGYTDDTWVLARLGPDGTLDTRFGRAGVARTGIVGEAHDIVAQPDGKLVAVGRSTPTGADFDATVARFRSDGRPDRHFGTGGVTTTDVDAGTDEAAAVAIGPDGAILAAGTSYPVDNPTGYAADMLVTRYHG